ncbi:MAG: class I SAM-dependent methyltransferase [Patescibacteria group bacterium]|nr:class I SAM-dependent methyltransferase [Patescibacteria group bacterium]
MSFYDNYYQRDKITRFGKFLVNNKNKFYLELILKFAKKDKENLKILEIGPGKGYFAQECVKQNINYTAIEGNDFMCKKLKEKGIKVYNKMVPPLNLKGTFDIIFMDQVFEHMENRDQALKLIEECKEHLNNQGLLFIAVPDIRYFKEDFFGCDYTHDFPLSLYSLKQIFVDFDFKIKYTNIRALCFKGTFPTKFIDLISELLYKLNITKLIFKNKSYKIKNLAHASCIVIGIKK